LQRSPPIPPEGDFCNLEGQDNTTVYNSGQFSRVFYRSEDSQAMNFHDLVFNTQPTFQDWNKKFVYGSNILLGKSANGPTFGYFGVAGNGDTLQFKGELGHVNGYAGWKNTIKVEGRHEKVVFAFNNTVYENVFLKPAIKDHVVKNNSTTQAKLVLQNNWSWAVGPPYEYSTIKTKPDLKDIPRLWPSEPVVYKDLEMSVSDGGDWARDGKWFLDFAEGLEISGSAFGNKLITNYSALEEYVHHLPKDNDNFEAIRCLWACIDSRRKGSSCTHEVVQRGYVRAHCKLQFDQSQPFPPKECLP